MIDVLLYLLGILIIVLGLGLSIGLHEIGHLIPAKLFGVKVTQYMVGFGKTLWSKRKGETEYGIKMIPLGGYIAMTGMYPPQKPGEQARASTTGFLNTVVQEGAATVSKKPGGHTLASDGVASDATLAATPGAAVDTESTDGASEVTMRRGFAGMVDDARLASAETIAVGEDARTFYRLPVWKKIIIMLGGPMMNLLLAAVFFGIMLMGFGSPQLTTTVSNVSECLIPAGSSATICDANSTASPAAAAGIRPGDTIIAIDGQEVTGWNVFRDTIAAAPNKTLQITVDRDGTEVALSLTPAANERWVTDDDGNGLTDAQGAPLTEKVGMVGLSPSQALVPESITAVPPYLGNAVVAMTGVIIGLPERMVDVWNAAFSSADRDPNGPVGMIGVGRLAGEIVSMDEAPAVARIQTMLGLLGSLNVALFVFNLVPLMPLDGGHIAGALYEGIKRGIARIRRKPDPGPVDTAKMVPITFAVVILLGAMTILLAYADIVKPITLGG